MERCLIDNKVCSEQHKKCKECKLDDCKKVVRMIEDEQKYIDISNMERLKKSLPEQCKECSFLIVTDLRKQKVYCPYRIKERCVLE